MRLLTYYDHQNPFLLKLIMFPFSSEMDVKKDYDGCSHYKRKCKLVAPCCGGVYSCRCVQMKIVNNPLGLFQVLPWRVSARPHDRPEAGHGGGVRGLRPQTGRGQGVCQVSGRAGVIGSQWPTTCDNWTSWDLWHKWHSHDPGSSLGMGVRLCLAPPTSAPCASCTMTQTRDSSTVRDAGYAGGMNKIPIVF